MKFYTFDETTYPGIPDEVGPETRLTNRFCDPRLAAETYREHLDEWTMCEELGFDGALVNEHHFTYFNINPSSTVLAAARIARTQRMKVGVIGQVPDGGVVRLPGEVLRSEGGLRVAEMNEQAIAECRDAVWWSRPRDRTAFRIR